MPSLLRFKANDSYCALAYDNTNSISRVWVNGCADQFPLIFIREDRSPSDLWIPDESRPDTCRGCTDERGFRMGSIPLVGLCERSYETEVQHMQYHDIMS
jgi:hypothetical protein